MQNLDHTEKLKIKWTRTSESSLFGITGDNKDAIPTNEAELSGATQSDKRKTKDIAQDSPPATRMKTTSQLM